MRFAVIGDIHGFWDERDTAFFEASDYDALLFVGDLPRLANPREVVGELARLTKPAWLMPGNHDGVTAPQLLAEIKGWHPLRRLTAIGMTRRVRRLEAAIGNVRLTGYALHDVGDGLGMLAARPHAMGPDKFYYGHYMKRRFGVRGYRDSADLLRRLVDDAPQDLIVLAHNGPAGLGDAPEDPWGCDFSDEFGDFGDPDLEAALEHARESGRRVHALVAGHMHHQRKRGGGRRTSARRHGTLYVNAASVPRIRDGGARRHHVALTVDTEGAHAETVIVDAAGNVIERTPLPEESP